MIRIPEPTLELPFWARPSKRWRSLGWNWRRDSIVGTRIRREHGKQRGKLADLYARLRNGDNVT